MIATHNKHEQQLDALFGALSNSTRRALLKRLKQGPHTISELAAPFDMSFPALSRHVRVLEQAQLVERKIVGREHVCSLSPRALGSAEEWLSHYRAFWDQQFDSLARHIARKRKAPKAGHR